ncbi:MAG: membrane protein insertion efficiency factor YidD [bacterium]
MKTINAIFSFVLTKLLRFYQLFISPLLGNRCRFYPTCSQYMIEAIQIHGVLRGILLGLKRLGRCQPFCEGGVDPVPELNSKKTHENCHHD